MKNMLSKLSLSLLILFFTLQNQKTVYAQNIKADIPASFNLVKSNKLKKATIINMPFIDRNLLIKEDSIANNNNFAVPFRFAKGFKVDYSLENSGIWDTLDTGDRIWRLILKSKSAFSLMLYFSEFKIPDGGKLFIYGIDSTNVFGALTSNSNPKTNTFKTQPIQGDVIIMEYFEPQYSFNQGKLKIGIISHDYRGFEGMKEIVPSLGSYGLSTCQTDYDINCPSGTDWQTEKGSVVRIRFTIGIDDYYCSGALVNNTNQNGIPYVLTASHCVCSQEIANTAVTVFNYESPTCNGGDGSVTQTVTGATLRANLINTDFALLELSSLPVQYANPYFSGWTRVSTYNPPLPVTSIHHPRGDVKKIAKSDTQSSNVLSTTFTGIGGTGIGCEVNTTMNVYAVKWAKGLTQQGSSGSPLFNADHKIIGQLYGSSGDCGTTYSYYNYFGRLSDSWLGNNSQSTQLKYWLDPTGTGTGVAELNGTYLYFISGPVTVCGSTATFSVKNLRSGDVINWVNSSNTSYISGQNTKNYTVQGGGNAWVQASITNSVGGYTVNLSKFYFTIGKPVVTSQIPLSYFSGSNYNNVCNQQSYTTSILVDGASSVTWSRIAATPSNTSWSQSGNNINFYFYNVNQTSVFKINASNSCGNTSYDFGFKSIDCSGGGGGGCNLVYTVSPNPVGQTLTITPSIPAPCIVTPSLQTENINGTISVFDNQGILKKRVNYKHISKTDINVSDLKNGTYHIEIYDGQATDKQTVIVQH